MNKNLKKYGALVIGGLVVLSAGAGLGYGLSPEKTVEKEVEVKVLDEEKLGEWRLGEDGLAFQALDNTDTLADYFKEAELSEEKIENFQADSAKLDMVLEHVFDNKGNVAYLTDDLDDDEVDQIASRIDTMNAVKDAAIKAVQEDGVDELDDELIDEGSDDEVELDDDDVERFKVEKDHDDLVVAEFDFEYNDFEIEVPANFEQDDVEYDAIFRVIFEDGIVDEVEVVEVAHEGELSYYD